MKTPVLAFFNSSSRVGKTSLAYHVAWMLAEMDHCVLAVDLDPQADLTAAFVDERRLGSLWNETNDAVTMYKCVEPLMKMADLRSPMIHKVADNLHLLPGDLSLATFEDLLSAEWSHCLDKGPPRGGRPIAASPSHRALRVASAFWQVIRDGVEQCQADLVLVDVGPSLGAINRSALIATDSVIVPLGPDLFSRQGLRSLGPTLRRWRRDWRARLDHYNGPSLKLPLGRMRPVGYVIRQHGVRLSRPVRADDRWAKQVPAEYARHVMGEAGRNDVTLETDPHCIATVKPFWSLAPLGRDARKPIFSLRPADGAIGSHAAATRQAYIDFRELAEDLLGRCGPTEEFPTEQGPKTEEESVAGEGRPI